MMQKQSKKMFAVHRVVGRYQIDGTIICIPAPRPGIETALVKLLIDERVKTTIRKKMIEDLFLGDLSANEPVVLSI